MQIIDIIENCVFRLGQYGNFDVKAESLSDEQMRMRDMLLRAVNLVYAELCAEHIPMLTAEAVELIEGRLAYSALSKPLLYALSLTRQGVRQGIKCYPAFLESEFSGAAVLEYAYLPDQLGLTDELPARIPPLLLTDGALAEYCYAQNLLDAAVQSERRYTDALSALKTKGAGKSVRARRWV